MPRTYLAMACLLAGLAFVSCQQNTGYPLIGIMSVPASNTLDNEYYQARNNFSYIPTSYIKFVSQAGAMPVLIPFDVPQKTLDKILDNVQGIHFIGGAANFGSDSQPSFFLKRVNYIMNKAMQKNDAGIYFPIVATCLGFEALTIAMSGMKVSLLSSGLGDSDTNHVVTPSADFPKSKIWDKVNKDLSSAAFSNGNLAYDHVCGFLPDKLQADPTFSQNCIITGTSISKTGIKFVAMVEHKKYPFFANQYHPEKTQFERIGPTWLVRDTKTIRFAQDFITTVVDQTRQYGKPLANVDPIVRAYFDTYHVPERPAWDSFEQIYVFQQLMLPSDPQDVKGVTVYEDKDDSELTKQEITTKIKKLSELLEQKIAVDI